MSLKNRMLSFICSVVMILAVLPIGAFSAEETYDGPVSYYGEMKVNGNKIFGDNTNRPMQVKGMSFFWSNWSTHMYNETILNKMVDDFKCDIVRCAYGIQDDGTPYQTSDVARIRTVVEAAIKRDIYVIIDWHSHGAHNNVEEAKAFFGMMAKDYGSYDNVIFEVFNEPTTVEWATVKSYAEDVVSEIRK